MQGLGRLQHVQQLRVVNLQQHPSNFTSQVWVKGMDHRIQSLPCVSQQRKTTNKNIQVASVLKEDTKGQNWLMPHQEAVFDPLVELQPTWRQSVALVQCVREAPSQVQEQPKDNDNITPMTISWRYVLTILYFWIWICASMPKLWHWIITQALIKLKVPEVLSWVQV